MTIIELYLFLQPLINILGAICLLLLLAGGTVFAIAWIIGKLWKFILAAGAATFFLFSAILVFSAL